jgi:hypothetical protein
MVVSCEAAKHGVETLPRVWTLDDFSVMAGQNVDARDVCAKTRFALLPRHDDGSNENDL